MRLHEPSLCQDPSLRQELASLARGCDFVLPSRFKKRLKAFQQVQVQTKEEPLPPASSQSIPTFYFPRGRPQGTVNVDAVIAKIERTFAQFPHERATMEDMGKVAKVFSSFGQTPRSVTAASYGSPQNFWHTDETVIVFYRYSSVILKSICVGISVGDERVGINHVSQRTS
nr:serine/threonine-protein phosphatase 2A regulatory subunit B'' subunit beta-like isoform X3 [Equus asinus]